MIADKIPNYSEGSLRQDICGRDALYVGGLGHEATICVAFDGRSMKISGCHEATETRIIRVKNISPIDTSPQAQ